MSTKNYNLDLQNNNIDLQEILDEINSLPEVGTGGGIDTTNATATAADILQGKTAYARGSKITGTIAFQEAKTITPGTASQTAISKGYYANGSITVAGDSNLKASYIKSGISIFGITGTLSATGGGGNTDIEDAFVTRTLTTYENDRVTTIGSCAFQNCNLLTSVNFPNCISISISAFQYCYLLQHISFPVCQSIGWGAFTHCDHLKSIVFPKASHINTEAFLGCDRLKSVFLPACRYIDGRAFNGCSVLINVTIDSSSVATLYNVTAFEDTPIAYKLGGYIYVPASLVNTYKSATNWATYADVIVAIGTDTTTISTFEIENVGTFQVELGMTWEDWCNSPYNTVNAEVKVDEWNSNGIYIGNQIISSYEITDFGQLDSWPYPEELVISKRDRYYIVH